jgi:hypothetical protein
MMYSVGAPLSVRIVVLGLYIAVLWTIGWIKFRNRKRGREYEKLHPPA